MSQVCPHGIHMDNGCGACVPPRGTTIRRPGFPVDADAESDERDVLRRIVEWRDDVHTGRMVRSADLEALIEEARTLLAVTAAAWGLQ